MVDISIVVPIYNMEKKLKRCLDSLVNQTFKNIEIILINDGSTDKSKNIIEEYSKKYKNIKVISRKNKGISYSRNEGIKKAIGKYIAFVDSDDYINLDMYEKLYNKIEKEKADIVVCNYSRFPASNPSEFEEVNISKKCKITNLVDNPSMVYSIEYGPCNKLYNKNLWDDIEFPVNVKYEDLEAVLKVFLKSNKVVYLNEYLYNYEINDTGETGVIDNRVFDIYIILDHLYVEFKNADKSLYNAYKKMTLDRIFRYVHMILNCKEKELCLNFTNEGYRFIKKRFKLWRIKYIFSSTNFKEFIMYAIRTIPFLYKLYLKKKLKQR